MGTCCADHVTPLYPQKLALTSPTGGGRSVGIVRSRTKATEFSLVYIYIISTNIPPIIIINRIHEHQNLLSLVSFLVGLRVYQHPCMLGYEAVS